MAHANQTRRLDRTEEAINVLFCLVDDAYANINPCAQRHEEFKRLSDTEVLALALFQQLCGVESQRSLLRDAERFSHLFPGVLGLTSSSFHRSERKVSYFLELLRRAVVGELVGDLETLVFDSALLAVLPLRQVKQSAARFERTDWGRWGSFALYGVRLHFVCPTDRLPLSYELTATNVADVLLVRKLLAGAGREEETFARKIFGLGETLAKTLVGLAIRVAAKMTACTYGLYVNRLFGRPRRRISELCARYLCNTHLECGDLSESKSKIRITLSSATAFPKNSRSGSRCSPSSLRWTASCPCFLNQDTTFPDTPMSARKHTND